MENRTTITQHEISQQTGLAQNYVSEALCNTKPVKKNGGSLQYNPREALEAVLAYCERRKQIVLDAAARKTAKWDNTIDGIRKLLEV